MPAITIPVQDLKRHYDSMSGALRTAALKVLDSGWYVLGEEVRSFEKEFATYLGANECISVANGTEALELALRAFQIGPGDEVCTVANAGMYSTIAILSAGATPVFVDVVPETLTMCPRSLASRITERTRAVIVTHLYGAMADLAALLPVAQKRSLPVIEDCAQAHGAKRSGKTAGTFGDAGCFSFYPTKNLGAIGDGGAIVVKDSKLAERLRALRQYGWTSRYSSTVRGGRNSRLDELQAAFLRVKLPALDRWNQRRQQIARAYNAAFQDTGLLLPSIVDDSYVAHLYVVRLPRRDQFRAGLAESGVGSDVHYPIADYSQESVRNHLNAREPLPETERACSQVVTLPCFPEMTDGEVEQVIGAAQLALRPLKS